jgi:hypothetical protein
MSFLNVSKKVKRIILAALRERVPYEDEAVSQCHPEAIAEGSRHRERLKMRDASLRQTV